jgi:hypothetical protein
LSESFYLNSSATWSFTTDSDAPEKKEVNEWENFELNDGATFSEDLKDATFQK